jgi:hypothetical protein
MQSMDVMSNFCMIWWAPKEKVHNALQTFFGQAAR